MLPYSSIQREKFIAANATEYGAQAQTLAWAAPAQTACAQERRMHALAEMAPHIELAAKQTKPHWRALSPGCRICARGEWSCLFINGQCNCRCFYCPTAQNDVGVPTTNRLAFPTPAEYAEYVERFNFSGVSISGGEPLLTFDRTLRYIAAVRRRSGSAVHIWMYTNGTLATAQRLKQLHAAGLDEIRFDISAAGYDLEKPRMAADLIPCVTVEIPAIPEDGERLTALLPQLHQVGVRHLNLHQLRLTPYNFAHLQKRNYTFMHGESVTVLESELTALSLLQTACQQELALPINYCSYVYKRRYQQAAVRRRNAQSMVKPFESVTESGFIRSLALVGTLAEVDVQAERLRQAPIDSTLWSLSAKKDRLVFHPSLWPRIDIGAGRLLLSYAEAVLAPNISYRYTFTELRLKSGKKIYLEKRPLGTDIEMAAQTHRLFEKMAVNGGACSPDAQETLQDEILDYEFIRAGLQEYF